MCAWPIFMMTMAINRAWPLIWNIIREQKFMALRRALLRMLAVVPLLSGCAHADRLPQQPITLPFNLAKRGNVLTTDFEAVDRAYTYTFSLDFLIKENDPEDFKRVAKLWGSYADYGIPISIPLNLTITRINEKNEAVVYSQRLVKLPCWASSQIAISKKIDDIKLAPGHYRVQLETLEAVTEAAETPVNFTILVQRK